MLGRRIACTYLLQLVLTCRPNRCERVSQNDVRGSGVQLRVVCLFRLGVRVYTSQVQHAERDIIGKICCVSLDARCDTDKRNSNPEQKQFKNPAASQSPIVFNLTAGLAKCGPAITNAAVCPLTSLKRL